MTPSSHVARCAVNEGFLLAVLCNTVCGCIQIGKEFQVTLCLLVLG